MITSHKFSTADDLMGFMNMSQKLTRWLAVASIMYERKTFTTLKWILKKSKLGGLGGKPFHVKVAWYPIGKGVGEKNNFFALLMSVILIQIKKNSVEKRQFVFYSSLKSSNDIEYLLISIKQSTDIL